MDLHLQNYTPEDAGRVLALQERNAARHRGAQVTPPEVYGQPAFAGGRHIPLALDGAGDLLGYGAICPPPPGEGGALRVFWAAAVVDPGLPNAQPVREALLSRLLALAEEHLRSGSGDGGDTPRAEIRLDPAISEGEAIAYALAHGFERLHGVYRMVRDLSEPLPDPPAPEGVVCRPWKMAGDEEMGRYLAARNAAFPERAWSLEFLRYFSGSPQWAEGTTFSAFAPDGDLVGSVMAYWDPAPSGAAPEIGYTEEVFCRPGWQRQGIATYLLAQALGLLSANAVRHATLQVSAVSEGVLGLYTRLGYRVVSENVILSRPL